MNEQTHEASKFHRTSIASRWITIESDGSCSWSSVLNFGALGKSSRLAQSQSQSASSSSIATVNGSTDDQKNKSYKRSFSFRMFVSSGKWTSYRYIRIEDLRRLEPYFIPIKVLNRDCPLWTKAAADGRFWSVLGRWCTMRTWGQHQFEFAQYWKVTCIDSFAISFINKQTVQHVQRKLEAWSKRKLTQMQWSCPRSDMAGQMLAAFWVSSSEMPSTYNIPWLDVCNHQAESSTYRTNILVQQSVQVDSRYQTFDFQVKLLCRLSCSAASLARHTPRHSTGCPHRRLQLEGYLATN